MSPAAYSYDENDRLLSQGGNTYRYDKNGNTLTQTLDGYTTRYQWDSQNRLIKADTNNVLGNSISTYGYDIDDNRIAKSIDDGNGVDHTAFLIDTHQDYAQVIEERDGIKP